MKITCQVDGLRSAAQLAAAAAGDGKVKPVLANAKLTASDESLTIETTDLEVGIRVEVRGVQVAEAGMALLPVATLVSILRETDGEILIEGGREGLMLSASGSQFDLPGGDVDSFPEIPKWDDGPSHQIEAAELAELTKRVGFAVSDVDAAKPQYGGAIRGVFWDLQENRFSLLATDGHVASITEGTGKSLDGHTTSKAAITPMKAIKLINRAQADSDVRIAFRPNAVFAITDRVCIYSLLLNGVFPNIRKMMPTANGSSVSIAAGKLLSAVRRACLVNDDLTKAASFTTAKGVLTIQSAGNQKGKALVVVPVSGDCKIDSLLDTEQLRDLLAAIPADSEITMEKTKTAVSALLIREGTRATYFMAELNPKVNGG